MNSRLGTDGNKLGRVLAALSIVAVAVWLGKIYTGSQSYCPMAILTGHCPFDAAR
jgi:hypothetical protein